MRTDCIKSFNKFYDTDFKLKKKQKGINQDINVKDMGDYRKIKKQEKITLNKHGRMRLKYLKEHKKADYSIMLMNGTLNTHLKELQETAQNKVEQIINQLKEKSNLNEVMKNTDILY